MCKTCNGIGVVHHTNGPVILFQTCQNCTDEERSVRNKEFEKLCKEYGVMEKEKVIHE